MSSLLQKIKSVKCTRYGRVRCCGDHAPEGGVALGHFSLVRPRDVLVITHVLELLRKLALDRRVLFRQEDVLLFWLRFPFPPHEHNHVVIHGLGNKWFPW